MTSETQEKIYRKWKKRGEGKEAISSPPRNVNVKKKELKDSCLGKSKEIKRSKNTVWFMSNTDNLKWNNQIEKGMERMTTTRNGDDIYNLFKSTDINLLKLSNKTELLCFRKK